MVEKIMDFIAKFAGFENDRVPWIIELLINFIGIILLFIGIIILILFVVFQYVIFFVPFMLIALLTPRYKLQGNNRAARFCEYYIKIHEEIFSND